MLLVVALPGVGTPAARADRQQMGPAAEPTLQGEAMYPRPARHVWTEVQALLREFGFRMNKNDGKNQVIVTHWRTYDARLLPDAAALGLPAADRPVKIQLHIAVDPEREPARLVVGSIVETERRDAGRVATVLAYRPVAIDAWFFATLDRRLGVAGEPMAGTVDGRQTQAARLRPAGLSDPCVPPSAATIPGISAPRKISDVSPVFPAQGFESGRRQVQVNGWMTEHGTLTNLAVANPSAQFAHYETSARAAVGLWRFRPAMKGGCPMSIPMMVTVNYTIR
jgi:TonB family protein